MPTPSAPWCKRKTAQALQLVPLPTKNALPTAVRLKNAPLLLTKPALLLAVHLSNAPPCATPSKLAVLLVVLVVLEAQVQALVPLPTSNAWLTAGPLQSAPLLLTKPALPLAVPRSSARNCETLFQAQALQLVPLPTRNALPTAVRLKNAPLLLTKPALLLAVPLSNALPCATPSKLAVLLLQPLEAPIMARW